MRISVRPCHALSVSVKRAAGSKSMDSDHSVRFSVCFGMRSVLYCCTAFSIYCIKRQAGKQNHFLQYIWSGGGGGVRASSDPASSKIPLIRYGGD